MFQFFQQCKIQLSNSLKLQILITICTENELLSTTMGSFRSIPEEKEIIQYPLIMIYNLSAQNCYLCQQVSIWSTYLVYITLQVLEKSMPSLIDLSHDFQEKCIYFSVVDSCHSWCVIWQGGPKNISFFISLFNFQMTILFVLIQIDKAQNK